MRVIGIVTTLAVGAGVVAAATVLVRSVPDIKRYLRIRSM